MLNKKILKTNNMKDIAKVIGHTVDSKGACSPFGVPCEWDFNSKVASYLTDIADIFTYSNYKSGYTTMVKMNADKINKGNYKLVIELHYNSAVDSSANGCKTLYYFKNKMYNFIKKKRYFNCIFIYKISKIWYNK